MKKMNYIAPRGDDFYYIEVWDKQVLRDSKISDILGEEASKPKYVNGSQESSDSSTLHIKTFQH